MMMCKKCTRKTKESQFPLIQKANVLNFHLGANREGMSGRYYTKIPEYGTTFI